MKNRHLSSLWLSRRTFLGTGITAASQAALPTFWAHLLGQIEQAALPPNSWPQFRLSREEDDLFLTLTAFGYKESSVNGHRYLEPVNNSSECRLIFTLPPQHYAETAIGVMTIPTKLEEAVLKAITLLPSRPSVIVFKVPQTYKLFLTLPSLLSWREFELLLPDLARTGSLYDLEIPDEPYPSYTRIEMPWGIDLTPLGRYGLGDEVKDADHTTESFLWDHNIQLEPGAWKEIWNTSLSGTAYPEQPVPFELLSVRGFVRGAQRGSTFAGDLVVDYADDTNNPEPGWLAGLGDPVGNSKVRPTASLTNLDRIMLAASLSRRFPYSGQPGAKPINTGSLNYISSFNATKMPVKHCYQSGRSVQINQFRLSARGGWLDFDSHWESSPDCGLTGWSHSLSLGRDYHVKLEQAGFLYPFGISANLIVLTDRAFVRDERGHFVAVLLKQVFIEVPQPNGVAIPNNEAIFSTVSVTTSRTESLDVPASGDPGTYLSYDYFVPTVDGKPFLFEHAGTDWAGSTFTSKTPLIFVSNNSRSPNGLIWEPGPTAWTASPIPQPRDAGFAIPTSGDGLRVVDKFWMSQPYRFANYNDALIALATPLEHGDTTQRVNWAEWVRGPVPPLDSSGVAIRPFAPRTRTTKLQLHGLALFSGDAKYSLATYRDVRYVSGPILDPEPTIAPDLYTRNLLKTIDRDSPYLHLLETRDLHDQPNAPVPEPAEMARKRIRLLYFGLSTGLEAIPDTLFDNVDNEIQFGMASSAAGTGGLVVPDTPVSTLSRSFGAVGDASLNARRWQGYAAAKPQLEAMGRLDYAAFRLAHRSQMDKEPFDRGLTSADLLTLAKTASAFMGYADGPAITRPPSNGATGFGLRLGDIFGADAELLPGLSFAQLFSQIGLATSTSTSGSSNPATAQPLTWKFRITGLEWLTPLLGSGPGQLSFTDLLDIAAKEGQSADTSAPIKLGTNASLNWLNRSFTPITLGPLSFIPKPDTEMAIDASLTASLGVSGLPLDFANLKISPGQARINAKATLSSFTISVFGAIEIDFSYIAFELSADGKKNVTTNISDVRLLGPLEFISQLSKMLGGLGGDSGMDIDVSMARIRISQTLKFPKTEGGILFLGPAQITNLSFGWAVMIPLVGRDVLSVSFALSTREKPLTIFVPPWYGGKAHTLIELTTKGLRLLEISMEYGALIPITWGIASGQASLTAGIFFMLEKQVDGKGALVDGKVIFRAFVCAAADLSVAGIIRFSGQIYISLSYVKDGSRKLVIGEAKVSCSIKIGFIRVSYSFSATHVEEAQDGQQASPQLSAIRSLTSRNVANVVTAGRTPATPLMVTAFDSIVSNPIDTSHLEPTMPKGTPGDVQLFGPAFDKQKRAAFERLLRGYVA